MSKSFRYPGIKPFTIEDKGQFFGRSKDIEDLSQMIALERMVVLFGKSGLGKTSLLNAGVLPLLKTKSDYKNYMIRFTSYTKGKYLSPLQILKDRVNEKISGNNLLDKFDYKGESLWHYFKNIQASQKSESDYILICDQFEELFTYPSQEIHEFKSEIAKVLNNDIPFAIKRELRVKLNKDPDFLSDEELELLYKPIEVKVVFSIRSDKMSLLDKFKDVLPDVLQNCYELEPLTIEQAKAAILKPASALGIFLSQPFEYEPRALKKILRYLSKDNTQKIEAFQLQILCQSIEQFSIENNDVSISENDVGDLEELFNNYYGNQIRSIGNEEEQYASRLLIENGLIFEPDERRLSLYEGQIHAQYNVSPELLKKLVDARLLRAEHNTAGGYSYELCHDTLVAPILKSKHIREAEEKLIAAELARKEEEARLMEKRRRERKRLTAIFGIMFTAFIISLGFAGWALLERANANKTLAVLEEKNIELNKSNDVINKQNSDLEVKNRELNESSEIINNQYTALENANEQIEFERDKAKDEAKRAVNRVQVLLDERKWLTKDWLDSSEFNYAIEHLIDHMRKEKGIATITTSMEMAVDARKSGNAVQGIYLAARAKKLDDNKITRSTLPRVASNVIMNKSVYFDRLKNEGITDFYLTPDEKTMILLGYKKFFLWDKDTGTSLTKDLSDYGTISSVNVSPDGRYLATTHTYKNYALIWDLINTDSEPYIIEDSDMGEISRASFFSDSRKVVLGSYYGKVKIYDVMHNAKGELLNKDWSDSQYSLLKSLKVNKSDDHILMVCGTNAFAYDTIGNQLEKFNNTYYVEDVTNDAERPTEYLSFSSQGAIRRHTVNIGVDTSNATSKALNFKSSDVWTIKKENIINSVSNDGNLILTKQTNNSNFKYPYNYFIHNLAKKSSRRIAHLRGLKNIFFIDNNRLLSLDDNSTMHVWDLNNQPKDVDEILANLPQLNFAEKLEHNLITFEELLKDGTKEEKNEALEYYKDNYFMDPSYYNNAIRLDPDDYEIYYNRGIDYIYMEEHDSAYFELKKALELNPDHKESYTELFYIGYNFYLDSHNEEAIKYYKYALEIRPEDGITLNNIGLSYTLLENPDTATAITYFLEAIEYMPDLKYPHYNLARIHLSQGNENEALKYITKAIEIDPNETVYNDLWLRIISKYDVPTQERMYNELISSVGSEIIYLDRALFYINQNQYQKAIDDYNHVLLQNPSSVLAHENLGYCYVRIKKVSEAIELFEKAIDLRTKNYDKQSSFRWLYVQLSDAHKINKNYAEVVKYKLKAVQIDEDKIQVDSLNISNSYGDISYYQILNKEFPAAEKSAIKAFSNRDDNRTSWIYTNLALSKLLQENGYDQSIDIYSKWMNEEYIADDAAENKFKYFSDAFLADIKDIKEADIIPMDRMDDVDKMVRFLNSRKGNK